MTADELGRRMHDDVGPVTEGLRQVRGGEGAVDHQGMLVVMRDCRHSLEIEHVSLGIAQRLGEEGLCVGPDGGAPGFEIIRVVDKGHLDPELGQCVVEEVVGAAVQRRGRHDVPPVLSQIQQCDGLGSLTARHRERRHSPFQGGDPLLEHGLRRIHDPGVDVSELLQAEQSRRMRCVTERVAGRLIDRNCPCPGGRVRYGTGMHLASFKTPIRH